MTYNDTLDPLLLEHDDDTVAEPLDPLAVPDDIEGEDIVKRVPVDPDEVAEPLDDEEIEEEEADVD